MVAQASATFTREELDLEKKIADRLGEGRLDVLAMPQVAMKVLNLINSDRADVADIAREVGRDQGIVTHILALANSAFYRGAVNVTSIEQAVIRLGLRELKGAVLMISLKNVFNNKTKPNLAKSLWEHSLATALLAKRIGKTVDVDADDVFTAGLVHDVGKIVVLALYERLLAGGETGQVSEQALGQLLDEFHLEAGRLLARDWDLPAVATEAIITHHSADVHSREGRTVALANKLAQVMGFGSPGSSETCDNLDQACQQLGVTAEMQMKLIEETPDLVAKLAVITA
jgi:HD-like signal output (HDOD) protein